MWKKWKIWDKVSLRKSMLRAFDRSRAKKIKKDSLKTFNQKTHLSEMENWVDKERRLSNVNLKR